MSDDKCQRRMLNRKTFPRCEGPKLHFETSMSHCGTLMSNLGQKGWNVNLTSKAKVEFWRWLRPVVLKNVLYIWGRRAWASSSAGAQALANRNYEVFKEHILKMVKSERRTYRAHGRHPKQNYSRKTADGRDSWIITAMSKARIRFGTFNHDSVTTTQCTGTTTRCTKKTGH